MLLTTGFNQGDNLCKLKTFLASRSKLVALLAGSSNNAILTRRDLQSVDWKEEMHQLLDEALAHIKVRCEVENSIIAGSCNNAILYLAADFDMCQSFVQQLMHLLFPVHTLKVAARVK